MDATQPSNGFRRAIVIFSADPRLTVAEVEDDFHHFRVRLTHDGARVIGVAAESIRHPWSLCPAAALRLEGLVGTPLTASLAEALERLPIREHCTHQYDLACLAIVHAAKHTAHRRIDITVADRIEGRTRATLAIDGCATLDWRIEDNGIVAPVAVSLKRGFVEWARTALDLANAEAAILLRRAVFVSNGRRRDLDLVVNAAEGSRNMGGCFVMRPGIAERATRVTGATRRFTIATPPLDPAQPPASRSR